MKRTVHSAFTLVESLIVVVMIAILSSIVAVLYQSALLQANDTQMRDSLDKFSDSLTLWSTSHRGQTPFGGYNTGAASYSSATQNCTNPGSMPITRWQDAGTSTVVTPNYGCTIGDTLVNVGYLPSDFFTKLPKNKISPNNLQHIMVYTCTADASGQTYVVMASLDAPTTTDTANFTTIYNSCFSSGAPNGGFDTLAVMQGTYNMQLGKKITLTQ